MRNRGLDETIASLRRLTTSGAVALSVLLVGALALVLASFLMSLSRFTPYGIWSVLALVVLALLAGGMVWLRGPAGLRLSRRPRTTFSSDLLVRAPPPIPVVVERSSVVSGSSGRLGVEASVNRLIEDRRYDEALYRLDVIEADDPAMATFCAVKRRAIERRRARHR
jgi:hypothetical protein